MSMPQYELEYNPETPSVIQTADWTCSACSLAWLNSALGIEHAMLEWSAVEYIGTPTHINATYGLMDGSGGRLVECLIEQSAPAWNGWFTWEQTFWLAQRMPLLIGGQSWYHWVGVRFSDSEGLYLANSAPGYGGVYDLLTRDDWEVKGPWAVVAVPLLRFLPPPPAV